MWLAAYGVCRVARSVRDREAAVIALRQKLRAATQATLDERAVVSEWLHNEISQELDVLVWRLKYLPNRRQQQGFDLNSEAVLLQRAIQRASQSVRQQEDRLRRYRAGKPVRACP